MKVYWYLFALTFQGELVYRANVLAFLLSRVAILVGFFFLWTSIYGGQMRVGSYSLPELLTYSFLTIGIHFWSFMQIGRQIEKDIFRGEINMYLVRPLRYPLVAFVRGWGHLFFEFGVGILGLVVLFLFFHEHLVVAPPGRALLALLLFAIGLILFMLLSSCVGLAAFWVSKVGGVDIILLFASSFLAGALLPVDLFPPWFAVVNRFLPFQYGLNYPLQVYLGRVAGAEIIRDAGFLLAWTVVFGLLVSWMWRRGIQRYEAVSG